MIEEAVTDVYRPHDAGQKSSSKRWREVSRKAGRGNKFLRLERTDRKIAYRKNGEEAEDRSRTMRWQYNEEDQIVSVFVESNLEPDFADYVFYKPDQELPYARLRWDSHRKQYILYTTSSERVKNRDRSIEEGDHSPYWDFSWKEINSQEARGVNLIPNYQTASTIMQDMMASPPANPTV